MKGVILLGEGELVVKEFDKPKPGRGEVVVRTRASGVCGSDVHVYNLPKKWHEGRPEMISGHEGAGIIEEIGEGVTMVRPGERVSIYHWLGCGKCKQCLAGYRQWCIEAKGMGLGVQGANADFILTKEDNCYVMPDELSFADGALMACGAGTAYSALSKLRPNGTNTLAVFGLGPVGLCGVTMAKAMGAQVVGIGRRECRLELARELGADYAFDSDDPETPKAVKGLFPRGVDMVFETSGAPEAHKYMLQVLRRGGHGIVVAGHGPEDSINVGAMVGKQLKIEGSFVLPIWMVPEMAAFIVRHKLPLEKMVTHRFPIEQAEEAFKLFDSGECGKVIFEW